MKRKERAATDDDIGLDAAGILPPPQQHSNRGVAAAVAGGDHNKRIALAAAVDPAVAWRLHFDEKMRQIEQEMEQAKAERYVYTDMSLLNLALELYNRQHTSPGIHDQVYVADEFWELKEVRGRHKKDCTLCDADFNSASHYVQESARGPWDAEKLCLECIGGKLRKTVGTDRTAIEAKLAPLRASQRDGIAMGCFANTYLRL